MPTPYHIKLIATVFNVLSPPVSGISCPSDAINSWIIWRKGSAVSLVNDAAALAIANGPVMASALSAPDLDSGVTIISTSTPGAINGTYALDTFHQLLSRTIVGPTPNKFYDGSTIRYWGDINEIPMGPFSVAQFTAFSSALLAFYDLMYQGELAMRRGVAYTWPSSTVTIP